MVELSPKFKKKYKDTIWVAEYFDKKIRFYASSERQAIQRAVEILKLKAKQRDSLIVNEE